MASTPPSSISDSVKERFWSRVDKRAEDECWPWTGCTIKDKRGIMWVDGKNRTAPSVSLELHRGQGGAENTYACHTCDNPNCVNPSHLWWGNPLSNMEDASAKGRGGKGVLKSEFCKQGHEYTPENTFLNANGDRWCKTCRSASVRASRTGKSMREVLIARGKSIAR